jgi:hypothetical protein
MIGLESTTCSVNTGEVTMVTIVFSRHAQRRVRLYRIQPDDVKAVICAALDAEDAPRMKYEIVNHQMASKYGHPLKVVCVREGDTLTVITAYPLKKERAP